MFTKLEIINEMLSSTGARPLLAADNRHPLYLKAERKLNRITQTVLDKGLWFNTEVRLVQKQANGEVQVPNDCIKADPTERLWNLVLRKSKMYNLNTGTFNIGHDLRLNMYFNLDWEDIPTAGQDYIRGRCVYEFYLDENGADPKLSHYRGEMNEGWQMLWREHLRNRQTNVFDNPSNTVSKLRKAGIGGNYSRRF